MFARIWNRVREWLGGGQNRRRILAAEQSIQDSLKQIERRMGSIHDG